jgi:hypothetical protein
METTNGQKETYGNKNFIITWLKVEIDKDCKEKVSEWQILSELLRIFEQIEKENEEKKRVDEERRNSQK